MDLKSMLVPLPEEAVRRGEVMGRIVQCVKTDTRIKLPDFDAKVSRPSDQFALTSIGLEENDFGGSIGPFRYQFEGEEDLLHLIVTRQDGAQLTVEQAQAVTACLLRGVPPALVWLRPGDFSQHFYLGHDYLLTHLEL